MTTYQSFNKRTKRWVKYRVNKQGSKIICNKKRELTIPFKNVPKR